MRRPGYQRFDFACNRVDIRLCEEHLPAGIEATNLCAMSFDSRDYGQNWVYHTPRDVGEHIEPEEVEAALNIIRGMCKKGCSSQLTT